MRLVCDRCGARFHIADDLLRGRQVKIRCRQCSATLEVQAVPESPPRRRRPTTLPPPLPTDRAEWFLAVGEGWHGPMALSELRLRIQRGEAIAHDLVWREGMGDWEPVAGQPELSHTLEAPAAVQRTAPPPLPGQAPSPGDPPVFEVIHGGGQQQAAAAVKPPPRPAPRPRPAPASRPAAHPVPRWPMLTLAASGLVLVATVVVVMVGRQAPAPAPVATLPAVARTPREPAPATAPASMPASPIAPMEIHARPRATTRVIRPPRAAPAAAALDAAAVAPADAAAVANAQDFSAATAARILRESRAALAACDRLAERRGERLERISAGFSVRVTEEGQVETTVKGEGVSAALLSCYSSVASRFRAPAIGRPYRVTFRHVH